MHWMATSSFHFGQSLKDTTWEPSHQSSLSYMAFKGLLDSTLPKKLSSAKAFNWRKTWWNVFKSISFCKREEWQEWLAQMLEYKVNSLKPIFAHYPYPH